MIAGNRRIHRLFQGPLSLAAGVAVGGAGWINPAPAPPAPPTAAATPARSPAPAPPAASGLTVAEWRLGGPAPRIAPDQPVTLSLTLTGGEAAVERLRREGRLRIEVHWQNRSGGGAPDLVTGLTIADAALAPILKAQVRRKGYFEWHSWARKNTLSPGAWTVSVTRPDGQPLPCGDAANPCRLDFNVG